MAKKIDYLTCMVGVTPYEHEGHNYDALNIIVAYRKGQGFVISWQPVKRQSMGYMTGPMPSSDPLVAGKGFVARAATRNNAKTLTEMRDNLQAAADAIRFYFDQRRFDTLKEFIISVAACGYTASAKERVQADMLAINPNNSTNNQNQETMATKNQTKNESANGVNNAMLKQYEDMKTKHPDAMLLFRVGDFYELYKQDAADASAILGITATKLEGMATAMFSHHALDQYLPKLIRAGKRIAICDQLEAPNTRKLEKRGSSETTTDNNSSTLNNDTTMATKNTTNGNAPQVTNAADEQKPVTLKRKQETPTEPISEQPQEVAADNALPQVTFSTYTTQKGATAPQIIGFEGEEDPRWVRNKGKKCVSASYRRDLQGNKVYILLFGTKYMDAARAMTDAYNTADTAAWEAAEAQAQATLEQAQADGKAAWEAKKAEWAAKKAAKKAGKPVPQKPTKTYTETEVAKLMQRVIDKDPAAMEQVSKMLEKAA